MIPMKILLVYPSFLPLEEEPPKDELKVITDHTLPLGICYLGAVLEKNNYEVALFDHYVNNIPIKKFVDWIIKSGFDVIGFSVVSHSFKTAIKIAEEIKKRNAQIKIIFGGVHPTFCADKTMKKYSCVDYCVRGEGEYTLLNLIKSIESNRDLNEVPNLTYRENGLVKFTVDAPPIQDIDELPIPDRKMLFKYHKYQLGGKTTPLITSRGCPFNCTFCSCGALYNRTIRYRSVNNVMEELLSLQNQGFKDIEIVDDCFLLKEKRVINICKEIKKEKLDISFHVNGRVNLGSFNLYRIMIDAGCKTISIGFESGVQRILDYYNKGITVERTFETMKIVKKARFETIFGGFILGAPTETLNEILQTIQFAFKLDPTLFQFQLLSILPGTKLYADFAKKGWIKDAIDWEEPKVAADVSSEVVQREILEDLIEKTYIKFITSPKRLIKEYLRSLSSGYRLRMVSTMPSVAKSAK
jgi:radical SAM superfamily enzyme YgiQ (UPF0313 family)